MTRTLRSVSPVLSAVILVAILTACSGGGGTPSGSPSGETSAVPSDSATASPSAAGGTAACTRNDLSTTFTATDGTAGHLHGILTFENNTSTSCTLTGYPTVYFGQPGAAGSMGAPASNDTADAGAGVLLAPGDTAVANLTITQAGIVEGCDITETDYFAVAPPGAPFDIAVTAQHVNADGLEGCANDVSLLVVGGVAAG
ncbi:MAG: DUF4232 domain-containing protein [Pseudolysinimonas sp.]